MKTITRKMIDAAIEAGAVEIDVVVVHAAIGDVSGTKGIGAVAQARAGVTADGRDDASDRQQHDPRIEYVLHVSKPRALCDARAEGLQGS